ncbi:hypothetical protein MYOV003v1_p0221 [Vibrio phage 207E48.1]|nr:hypothetical protein MYOV003v1_p0221 [Vibrio phage 207E48.1]
MIVKDTDSLIKLYVESTQGVSDFHTDIVRYAMCDIEGQTVNVQGRNMNTYEEFEFKFVVADMMLWYANHCIEQLMVTVHG